MDHWTMLEEDLHLQALGDFERRVLRTIFGNVQENGVWQRRMDHEIGALYDGPSIQKVTKAESKRWAGHVARMPGNTLQSWCSQLIRLTKEGVERRYHEWRTRQSVIWRTLGVTKDGER